jgi:hypothetical protein
MKTRHERGEEPDRKGGESMEGHGGSSPGTWSGVGKMEHGAPNAGPRAKILFQEGFIPPIAGLITDWAGRPSR